MTHYVAMGFSEGQIDLMRFFPSKLRVRPGDTVVWEMQPSNDAPHTVTFLNGEPEPGLVIPVPQPSGPPVLYINPATLFPSPLRTRTADPVGPVQLGAHGPHPGDDLLAGDRRRDARAAAVPVPAARHERDERHAGGPAALSEPVSRQGIVVLATLDAARRSRFVTADARSEAYRPGLSAWPVGFA